MTVEYMPPIAAYMAMAEALHSEDDNCNANFDVPFADCGTREWDIEQAVKVLIRLHKDGWRLTVDSGGSLEMGLA